MSNFGVVSRWHERHDEDELLATLKKGDLVEFDRGNYSHWAVYLGEKCCFNWFKKVPSKCQTAEAIGNCNFCIVFHLRNVRHMHPLPGFVPTDNVALVDPSDGGLLEYSLDAMCVHRANPGHHEGVGMGGVSASLSKKASRKGLKNQLQMKL